MHVKLKILLLLMISLMLSNTFALTVTDSISSTLNTDPVRSFNGVILISKNNHIIYQKSQGKLGSPKENNQFVIGSISKQLTAAIILGLVDKGLIDLNKPIKNYLPELTDEWASQVTVKQLLNHTSGILALGKPLAFVPGTKFTYSPVLGFYLASQIAEKVSGQSYEHLLETLFHRAKMTQSGTLTSANMKVNYQKYPHLITAFSEKNHNITAVTTMGEEGKLYDRSWNPAGGIISTAHDLLKWNLALHNGAILSAHSYQQMMTPLIERDHPRYGKVGYGFGIQVLKKDGYLEFSHSGYIDGYLATLIYYPKTKLSVILLENVSWDIDNVRRAFKVHDDIREIIRKMVI